MRRALVALLLPLLVTGCDPRGETTEAERAPASPASPRHLFLITIDTYRADHLGGRRAGVELTPRLAGLAARGMWYTAAHTVADSTSPGVAGILTGLLPFRSGVVENRSILAAEVPTLGARLQRQGFATAAFVANPVLRPGMGFDQGFERYEVPERRGRKVRADTITERSLAWLRQAPRDRRLHLWLHYMEPHGPYTPPDHARERFPPESFEAPREIPLKPSGDNRGRGAIPYYQQVSDADHPPSRDGRDYLARYAAEVHYLDDEVGRFLAELERGGWMEDSVVVLTADHGEALAGDHGCFFSHNNGLTQDQIHVPLVLYYPGVTPARREESVSTLDLLPTVLELLGLPADPEIDGRSLFAAGPRVAISADDLGIAVRRGDLKLTYCNREDRWRLFDLARDPGELEDLAAEQPGVVEELRNHFAGFYRRPRLAEPQLRETVEDRKRREELRSLGYL